MSPDDNKAVIRAYVETIFNQQSWIAPASWCRRTTSIAALPGQSPGLEGASSRSGRCTWPAS